MALKPIIHGIGDPFEIPYYCHKCRYAEINGGTGRCTKNKSGKLSPEVGYTCFKMKPIGGTENDKRCDSEEKKD